MSSYTIDVFAVFSPEKLPISPEKLPVFAQNSRKTPEKSPKILKNPHSDELILYISAQYCALRKIPFPEGVSIDRKGKPAFSPDVGIHFSVSHSNNLWCCAFSPHPLGLDVEAPPFKLENREKIARRFFHPSEVKWLESQGFSDFYKVWTAKESAVKFTGEGITENFGKFYVADSSGLLSEIPMTNSPLPLKIKHIDDIDNAYIALCAPGHFSISLHRL